MKFKNASNLVINILSYSFLDIFVITYLCPYHNFCINIDVGLSKYSPGIFERKANFKNNLLFIQSNSLDYAATTFFFTLCTPVTAASVFSKFTLKFLFF